ncbi:DUF2975 domain-containing protein [Nocardioides immobilis]|uniref:DUF2975 domain-containing protein n=1 Tax=Nocardioides immobilis TaxID=2049295 RepID=A0A417XS87_9ACTN|nr:DUF2975 domain-containing protein [Nocardioides immobilis]RHW23309.1 DUF2975 domain-containing protein [Nocardioides immobilis]
MGNLAVLALRTVLVIGLLGTAFVQVVMVPLLAIDLSDVDDPALDDLGLPWQAIAFLVIVVLGIITVQVTMVCVWRLLTMVRRGTVFSDGAFRYVDIVIGSIACASLLTFALGTVLAPGDAAAPGTVLMIGGVGVLVAGMAILVYVLRSLLAQAVARDAEATQLQAELDEVI